MALRTPHMQPLGRPRQANTCTAYSGRKPRTGEETAAISAAFSQAGVDEDHSLCITCLKKMDLPHRINWFHCTHHCALCRVAHPGRSCPAMRKDLGQIFHRDWFRKHADLNGLYPWEQYGQTVIQNHTTEANEEQGRNRTRRARPEQITMATPANTTSNKRSVPEDATQVDSPHKRAAHATPSSNPAVGYGAYMPTQTRTGSNSTSSAGHTARDSAGYGPQGPPTSFTSGVNVVSAAGAAEAGIGGDNTPHAILSASVAKLQAEMKEMRAELAQTKKKLAEKTSEIDQMKTQIYKTKGNLTATQGDLGGYAEDLTEIRRKLEEYGKEANEFQKETNDFKEKTNDNFSQHASAISQVAMFLNSKVIELQRITSGLPRDVGGSG